MGRFAIAPILALCALGLRLGVQEESGNRSFREGDYRGSIERYREALEAGKGTPRLHYNLGTALLELGEWDEARAHLEEALQAQDPEIRIRAFYNLGNAYARTAEEGPRAAESLRSAVHAYRRALLLDPDVADVKWNLELAKHRLQELEQRTSPLAGRQQQPRMPRQSDPGGDRDESQERSGSAAPQPGEPAEEPRDLGDAELGPLPQNLAEQILRAVEEQERGLQREKLRRTQPRRRAGPDW